MKKIKWTPEMDSLLGKLSDTEIGKRFNISRTSVYNRRKQLDIPRCPQKNHTPPPFMGGWNKYKWKEKYLKLLGTMPDYKLASLMNISKTTVANKRRSLDILSYEKQTRFIKWTPEMDAVLGTDYDKIIARQLGVFIPAIAQRRYSLGIPSCASKHRIIPQNVHSHDKEVLNFYTRRRRAIKKCLPHTMTIEDWQFTLAFFNYKCAYCEVEVSLTQDHLNPIANNGGYIASNIVPACGSCNSSKGTKEWKTWVKSNFSERTPTIIEQIEKYQQIVS